MALQKQPVAINFVKGLDTKADPYQVSLGNFLSLQNSVFTTTGRLTKRNGYGNLTSLPNTYQTNLTTFDGSLIATGANLYSYSSNTKVWEEKGSVQPVDLSVRSLIRTSQAQIAPDSAIASNGVVCTTYTSNGVASYRTSDGATGEILGERVIGNTATDPRVFLFGQYFIVIYKITVSATTHLQFFSIPVTTPNSWSTAQDVATNLSSLSIGYDGYILNGNLYLGWGNNSGGVSIAYIAPGFIVSTSVTVAGHQANLMSVTADSSNQNVWFTFWSSASSTIYTMAYNSTLFPTPLLATTAVVTGVVLNTLTSIIGIDSVNQIFYEVANTYTYDSAIATNYVNIVPALISGSVGTPRTLRRSVGLASKPIVIPTTGVIYVLTVYGDAASNQPSYFLIDNAANIVMRLAYSNGGGFETTQVLPTISLFDGSYNVPYLIKDLITTVNKETAPGSTAPVNAIYTLTGVNLATFSINASTQYGSEIANSLHVTGGQLWQYDGVAPVEHGFHVWPEHVEGTAGAAGTANTYFYQFCYEWTDNQGNVHKSAPSIPVEIQTATAIPSIAQPNVLKVPCLRLTEKIDGTVRIVGYRWSAAQQVYYQFTSVTSPSYSTTGLDYITISDSKTDAQILGNAILYTTGGVVENIAAPASIASALFKSRLFLVDAEDPNLLWFSKQVIEGVPVEMSDLLTLYVAPTSGAQGSTGSIQALGALDDKLIIFKRDAIYYLTGIGPDNTGSNNDFSDPIFITSAVGCSNPRSIVLMPTGLMFQSDKGIWLLGRDLSTTYIGAAVEAYNDTPVLSAQAIPGTNQVRFVLGTNTTLMYDYYFQQWGTFTNTKAISATLYQNQHTYLNSDGLLFQETPGIYLDGSSPVLLSFTTSWFNLAGLQGYERFYDMLLLGTYYTPFKLNVQIAYDYNPSPQQATIVTPDNYSPNWGLDPVWGANGPWGGPGNVVKARVFPQIQKCEAFQLTITEVYDNFYGVAPGQGLSLSGILTTIGVKRGSRTSKAANSFG